MGQGGGWRMRYDAEIVVSQAVVDYLRSIVDLDIQAVSPVVTFFDPMSVDEANRVVVFAPAGETNVEAAGHFGLEVECGLKSRWAQPSVAEDFQGHFERVNEVRDKICPADLLDRINAQMPSGAALDFVNPGRTFTTAIRQGWIYSESRFRVSGFFKTES